MEFDPRLGYKIEDPEDFQHNGTYLCEFTDTGSGRKVNSLVIDLLVEAKKVTKTFVQVNFYNPHIDNDSMTMGIVEITIMTKYGCRLGLTSVHISMLKGGAGEIYNY